MQEDKSSSEQANKINLNELRALILTMSKQDAMDYILGDEWYGTPRPFQIAIQVRAGWNWLEMYIATSIENLGRKGNVFYQSEKQIAELLDVSPGAVRKAAARLKEKGLIVRAGKSGQRARQWTDKPTTLVTSTPLPLGHQAHYFGDVDPTTLGTSHNNKKDLKKKKENKKEDKKEKTPPSLPRDSNFKKEDKNKALEFLNGFDLLNHLEFSKSYFGLLELFKKKGGLIEMDDDRKYALECLEKTLPRDYRRQAILADWMIWYVLTPPRPKEPPYFTKFKKSWADYLPTATVLLEAITAPERQQRVEEMRVGQEQQRREMEKQEKIRKEQERQRREKMKADAEAKRQKAIEAEAARKKAAIEEEEARKRDVEVFQSSLPSLETIRLAVDAAPVPSNWLDNNFGYLSFMEAMLASVPTLRLVADIGPNYLNYTPLARDSFGGDIEAFERKSRDFVATEAEHIIGKLKANGISKLPKLTLEWKRFARYFGIPEESVFPRPESVQASNSCGSIGDPFGLNGDS